MLKFVNRLEGVNLKCGNYSLNLVYEKGSPLIVLRKKFSDN